MFNGLTNLTDDMVVDVKLGDRKYALTKWTIGDYADREAHVVRKRTSVDKMVREMAELAAFAPKESRIMDAICKGLEGAVKEAAHPPSFATDKETAAFNASDEGLAFDFFLSARSVEENGIKTLADAKAIVASAMAVAEDDFVEMLGVITLFCRDTANLGNSSCPYRTRQETAEASASTDGGQVTDTAQESLETIGSSSE